MLVHRQQARRGYAKNPKDFHVLKKKYNSIEVLHGLAWKINVKPIEITQTQGSREHVLEHFRGKTDRNRHMPQTVIIVSYIDAYSIRNVWKCFLCVQCVRKVNVTCLRQEFRAFSASQDLM